MYIDSKVCQQLVKHVSQVIDSRSRDTTSKRLKKQVVNVSSLRQRCLLSFAQQMVGVFFFL